MPDPALAVDQVADLLGGCAAVAAGVLRLSYTAENYPLGVRGRATGLVAGSSKLGGVAVQGFALAGFIPTLGGAALALLAPMAASAALVAYVGRETRCRSQRELEARTG